MSAYIIDSVISGLERNKKLREENKYINIPFPFSRFRTLIPGIQQSRYYLISASPKVGKTQITDFLFMLYPYFFIRKYNTNIKLKIFYFSLEISASAKIRNILSFFLYLFSSGKSRFSADQLDSQYLNYILSDDLLSEIKKLSEEIKQFENCIEIIDDIRNPYGIFKHLEEYALSHGTLDTLDLKTKSNKTQYLYTQDNPDEYRIVIIDHLSLLSPEERHRGDLHECIREFSKEYCLKLRDKYNYVIAAVQQQAGSQESAENVKLDMLQPSPAGLADCKYTARDCNMMLTLFSPARFKKRTYAGYDIATLNDSFRELGVCLNRNGNNNIYTPLYFDGGVNYFEELPYSSSTEMTNFYEEFKNNANFLRPKIN